MFTLQMEKELILVGSLTILLLLTYKHKSQQSSQLQLVTFEEYPEFQFHHGAIQRSLQAVNLPTNWSTGIWSTYNRIYKIDHLTKSKSTDLMKKNEKKNRSDDHYFNWKQKYRSDDLCRQLERNMLHKLSQFS